MSDLFEKSWIQREIENKWFAETGEMDVENLPNRFRSFSMELSRRVNRIRESTSDFEVRRKLSRQISQLSPFQLVSVLNILAENFDNIENVGEIVLNIEDLNPDLILKILQFVKSGDVKSGNHALFSHDKHFVHEKTDSTRHSNDSKSNSEAGQEVDASAMVSATDNANKIMQIKPTSEKKEINLDNAQGWQDLVKEEHKINQINLNQSNKQSNKENQKEKDNDSDDTSLSDDDKNQDQDIWSDFQSRAQRQTQREKELKDEEEKQKQDEKQAQKILEEKQKEEQEAQTRKKKVEIEREMLELQAQTGEEVRLIGPFLEENKKFGQKHQSSNNLLSTIGLRTRGKDESDDDDYDDDNDDDSQLVTRKFDKNRNLNQNSEFQRDNMKNELQNLKENEIGVQAQLRHEEQDTQQLQQLLQQYKIVTDCEDTQAEILQNGKQQKSNNEQKDDEEEINNQDNIEQCQVQNLVNGNQGEEEEELEKNQVVLEEVQNQECEYDEKIDLENEEKKVSDKTVSNSLNQEFNNIHLTGNKQEVERFNVIEEKLESDGFNSIPNSNIQEESLLKVEQEVENI
eukprot:TRINITY_DN5338_c0_g1_i7.p1 TRINITY_DN5338_c0_g1~~TRINITY_DN5338_c0_g1_i7.p1  ORF type:complete len:572 (+),score=106.49 TRINITY_DN5338_c0_g1_i7:155-1870(+)